MALIRIKSESMDLSDDYTFTGTVEGAGGGITEADQWRLTTTGTFGDTYLGSHVSQNWERNDTGFTLIGTGMTQSSGVFTFPTTGIYHIEFVLTYRGQQAGYDPQAGCEIGITTDNSTYNNRAKGYTSHQYDGNYQPYMQSKSSLIFDVTNTTTHKVKFYVMNNNTSFTTGVGNTGANQTYSTFIRLGDT